MICLKPTNSVFLQYLQKEVHLEVRGTAALSFLNHLHTLREVGKWKVTSITLKAVAVLPFKTRYSSRSRFSMVTTFLTKHPWSLIEHQLRRGFILPVETMMIRVLRKDIEQRLLVEALSIPISKSTKTVCKRLRGVQLRRRMVHQLQVTSKEVKLITQEANSQLPRSSNLTLAQIEISS